MQQDNCDIISVRGELWTKTSLKRVMLNGSFVFIKRPSFKELTMIAFTADNVWDGSHSTSNLLPFRVLTVNFILLFIIPFSSTYSMRRCVDTVNGVSLICFLICLFVAQFFRRLLNQYWYYFDSKAWTCSDNYWAISVSIFFIVLRRGSDGDREQIWTSVNCFEIVSFDLIFHHHSLILFIQKSTHSIREAFRLVAYRFCVIEIRTCRLLVWIIPRKKCGVSHNDEKRNNVPYY